MTELVVILTSGKNTWPEVAQIMNNEKWTNIIIVTNEFGAQTFTKKDNTHFVIIDENVATMPLVEFLTPKFRNLITGTEVALNMVSGTGKEHMAVLSALLKTGVAIRLVSFDNKIVEL